MDIVTQALLVISLICAAHERFVEALQGALSSAPWAFFSKLSKPLTTGRWSMLPPVVMAVATNADLLLLFSTNGGKPGEAFFAGYLTRIPADMHELFGCVLMGMCASLGSRFWHDLAYGMLDLRNNAKAAAQSQITPAPPPVSPPSSFVTPA